MKAENIINAIGSINDDVIRDAKEPRKTHHNSWMKWAAMAACLCLVICVFTIPHLLDNSNGPISGDLAPMVYVNDTLYQITENQPELADKENEFVYLGKIESKVSAAQKPEENFQANDDIVGAEVYQYGNNIVILIDGTYWLYENKANTNGEVIEFHGSQFSKADLSAETLEWLEWYNSLSPEEQLAISAVPSELYASNGSEANADDYIVFHGKTFLKANLSDETLEWLEWYNSLSAEEQLCVNSIPSDLYTYDGTGTVEAGAVE